MNEIKKEELMKNNYGSRNLKNFFADSLTPPSEAPIDMRPRPNQPDLCERRSAPTAEANPGSETDVPVTNS